MQLGNLYGSVLNEFEKIMSRKKTLAFMIFVVMAAALSSVLIPMFQNRFGILVVTASNFPVIILNLFTGFVLPLCILMVTVDLFSGEVQDRSMKLVIFRPISRFKIFLSKNLAVLLYIVFNLLIILLTTLVCEALTGMGGSYGGAVKSGFTAFLVSILPQLTLGIFAAFLCQFFRSSTAAIVTSLFILVAARIISLFFPLLSKVLFVNFFNWATLWMVGYNSGGRLLAMFMLMISYGLIFFASGFYLYDRKEF